MAMSGLHGGNVSEIHVTRIDVHHYDAKDIPSGSLAA